MALDETMEGISDACSLGGEVVNKRQSACVKSDINAIKTGGEGSAAINDGRQKFLQGERNRLLLPTRLILPLQRCSQRHLNPVHFDRMVLINIERHDAWTLATEHGRSPADTADTLRKP